MPTISVFYGVSIRMYVKDHPPPHFHAAYAEWEACFSIETGEITEGRLPLAPPSSFVSGSDYTARN
jgi:hypothetical protein